MNHSFPVTKRVDVLVYIISVSNYDELTEDKEIQMKDQLNTFEEYISKDCFKNCELIIYWNKIDVLEKKISIKDELSNLFPDYNGGNDSKKALEFIQDVFKSRIPENIQKRVVEFTGSSIFDYDVQNLWRNVESSSKKVVYQKNNSK